MRVFFLFLSLQLVVLPAVSADVKIRHVTVDDYLQQAAAIAKQEGRKANNLINESSPYLLQHAYNPVNWYAWGDEAFEKARKENKPIFLSIGYSTCHWCHVMAHESFENKQIAEVLNKYFVCIKVDREQRPDIDTVYMSATQLINGHGGWPMSVFLYHRLRPFHAATYYPPFSVDGRKGLNEVLLKINELWHNQPDVIEQAAISITARITYQADETGEEVALAGDIYKQALQDIIDSYEPDYGGFSIAPKFPRPGIFAFLNRLVLSSDKSISVSDKKVAKMMIKTTLDAMASGGIYDQVAGGFHRYSVDENWQVPHFEKMLYSQALMVSAYNGFYEVDATDKYRDIVYDSLAFVSQEMRSPGGGFYSALDADSYPADDRGDGKKEGAYYLWSASELKKSLSAAEFKFVKKYYQVREDGNIHSDPQDEFRKLNILYIDEESRDAVLSVQQASLLSSVKEKLNDVRYQRPRPHLDDKVITAWNGMMISAFARSSQIYEDPAFLAQAEQTAGFIKTKLYDEKSGTLFRQYRPQENKTGKSTEGALTDYAWLIYGLLDIYEASQQSRWLNWASALHEKQDELFLDEATGAYFESVSGDDSLLFRSRSIYDGALPSANAIALSNLRRLSVLVKESSIKQSFSSQADRLVNSFASSINNDPSAAAMLLAVELEQDAGERREAGP